MLASVEQATLRMRCCAVLLSRKRLLPISLPIWHSLSRCQLPTVSHCAQVNRGRMLFYTTCYTVCCLHKPTGFTNTLCCAVSCHFCQVLRLVSLPIWHGLSHGRLQLELAAQPALAKRWKALLKKEAKAAAGSKTKKKDKGKAKAAAADSAAGSAAAGAAAGGAAAAAAGGEDGGAAAAAAAQPELPRAEAAFLPGMIQEFLTVLRAADAQLAGQQQQQAAAAADAEPDADDDEEAEEEDQELEDAAAEPQADSAAQGAEDTAAANGHSQQGDRQQQQGRKQQPKRGSRDRRGQVQRLLLRHLERFVEWLIDLLSQLPTRRFVHALLEDQQLLVKVSQEHRPSLGANI